MSKLNSKQIASLNKAQKLMEEVQRLFDSVQVTQQWCPILGQTDTAISDALRKLKGFNEFKINQ